MVMPRQGSGGSPPATEQQPKRSILNVLDEFFQKKSQKKHANNALIPCLEPTKKIIGLIIGIQTGEF